MEPIETTTETTELQPQAPQETAATETEKEPAETVTEPPAEVAKETAAAKIPAEIPQVQSTPPTETASPSSSETSTEPVSDPAAQSIDDLGYPPGIIGRAVTLAIAAADPGGYSPGEIVVKLSPKAQLGLRRLAAGRAAGGFVDYAGTVRTILEGFAQ